MSGGGRGGERARLYFRVVEDKRKRPGGSSWALHEGVMATMALFDAAHRLVYDASEAFTMEEIESLLQGELNR